MGRLPVPRGECRFTIAALAPLRHDFSVPFRSLFFRHLLLRPTALLASLGLALLAGCGQKPAGTGGPATSSVPVFTYEVVHTWPHDPGAFTQGLVYLDGALLESTGLNGRSSLRDVELATGRVQRRTDVPAEFFAEGMTVLNGKVFQLTWQNQQGFVYDLASFAREKAFTYTGEGWGLTTDGHVLIMSDGTAQIRCLDPATFAITRSINVTLNGQPLAQLNELEWVKGEIWANVWQTPAIARIDPATGRVLGLIDLTGLLPAGDRAPDTDVLNGIAYDAAGDRIFVTGKNWPKVFEVRLRPK